MNPQRTETAAAAKINIGRIFACSLGCFAVLASGCAAQKKKATIPWASAVLVRPVAPESQSAGGEAAMEDPVPDLKLEIPPPPAPLAAEHMVPQRPRVAVPPANSNAPASKTEPPKFVPDLSAPESASFQKQAEQSLSEADRNLASASGKSLNATQSDLASKVRDFMADARQAAKTGDWSLARDLARKAQVLSEELLRSL